MVRWAVAAALASLVLAAPAHAQTSIEAPDMEIDVGDTGDFGASFNTDGFGQVVTDAELQIDAGGTATGSDGFVNDSPGALSGTGTAADPYTVTTAFHGAGVQVTETVTHVSGDPRIPVKLVVHSTAAEPVHAIEWGEVDGGGFAEGTGALQAGPPRYLAGVFPTTASVSGLEEITPWNHYEEADEDELSTQVGTGLDDTVSTVAPHQPAVAAQWDLAAGETKTIEFAWRFVPGAAHIDLQPGDGTGPPDQPACFTATVTDVYGAPVAAAIEFTAGDPHPDLDTTTDVQGHAAYCATAADPGEELFVDASVPDAALDAFSTWEFTGGPDDTSGGTPPAPVGGHRLTARVVSGKVRLRHDGRFTALRGTQSIKVGAMLDARHGTVELTAAVSGHRQTGRFGAGFFRVRQASAHAPVALALAGASFGSRCRPGSHRIVRRLRATTARGRWQTAGRRSTAGVTKAAGWITQDRCDGTLTVVRTGAATVRGAHGHSVPVRAGHRRLVRRD